MFIYAVIKSDDTITLHEAHSAPEYDTISAAVGGWIEGVALEGVTAYVNEEGKLQGLSPNKIATILAHEDQAIMPADYIAGDMIVFGPLDDDGEVTTLSSDFIPGLIMRLGITTEV